MPIGKGCSLVAMSDVHCPASVTLFAMSDVEMCHELRRRTDHNHQFLSLLSHQPTPQ